jgi:hypothetical protein
VVVKALKSIKPAKRVTRVKQAISIGLVLATLAACAPAPVPNSGAGVGFNDYATFELQRAQREAALTSPAGRTAQSTAPTSAIQPPSAVQTQAIPSSQLAAAGIGQSQASAGAPLSVVNTGLDPTRTQGIDASPTNAAPALANNPGISDEQDFSAVASRETIQSDAQRIAANAAALETVAPTALPTRPSDTGPNIVQYALNAPNVKGQEWYSRSILSGQGRFQRNCAGYNNPDEAQRDFLSRGGPDRDPRGIDPDGDGFACGWDPAPFKLAAGN